LIAFIVDAAKKMLRPSKIFLFGSRSRGDALERSDYDFAIMPAAELKEEWSRFSAEVAENAPTLHHIDLVNMGDDIDPKLRHRIELEGKILHES